MPRPNFDASYDRSSASRKTSSGFGEPPTLRTRTGQLARKNYLRRLLEIANEGDAPSKPVNPVFTCQICDKTYNNPATLKQHKRACEMLRKGEMLSDKRKPVREMGSRRQKSDGLDSLLAKTAAYGESFKAGSDMKFGAAAGVNNNTFDFSSFNNNSPLFDDDLGPNPGFSGYFNTNSYVKIKLQRQRKEREEAQEKLRQAKKKIETEWDFRAEDKEREKEEARREKQRRTFDVVEHEARWSQFVNRSRGKNKLKLADVPFIPEEQRESLRELLDKAKVRAMILRWHPDKFGSTYGGLFRPEEVELVMEGVKETSRMLLELLPVIG